MSGIAIECPINLSAFFGCYSFEIKLLNLKEYYIMVHKGVVAIVVLVVAVTSCDITAKGSGIDQPQ